ncbi:ABC-three component system protein [Janthinobacterium sp. PSPC2-1]|uniref:ABC-three component system protein n=1 Tax=unclassified Janthinobacterium TaxID=2610881 RepID=UPI003CF5F00C
MNKSKLAKSKHNAPGQYLGFALQPLRMFYHLLTAPKDACVSMELVDDVAVHYANGEMLVEQTKSALSHNPLSNWAVDLWKTIANWIDDIDAGRLNVESTVFQLYVTPAHEGQFSSSISKASTREDVAAVVASVSASLAAAPPADDCLKHVQKFLSFAEDIRWKFVRRIQIASTDRDPVEALCRLLIATTDENLHELLCATGIGLAKERADSLIRQRKPAKIECGEFQREFRALARKSNTPAYIHSMSPVPDPTEVNALLLSRPDFVAQLDFVGAQESQKLRAVSDFLRTKSDKVKWADDGLVFKGSFDELDDDLLREHESIESLVSDEHSGKDEATRGRMVYVRCTSLKPPVEGKLVPQHFTPGSFNALADSRRLGWHPRYTELFLKDEE